MKTIYARLLFSVTLGVTGTAALASQSLQEIEEARLGALAGTASASLMKVNVEALQTEDSVLRTLEQTRQFLVDTLCDNQPREEKMQRKMRMKLSLPDQKVWKKWYMQSGLAQSRQFTSAQMLHAMSQLLLAMARSNAQNQDIPQFVLSSSEDCAQLIKKVDQSADRRELVDDLRLGDLLQKIEHSISHFQPKKGDEESAKFKRALCKERENMKKLKEKWREENRVKSYFREMFFKRSIASSKKDLVELVKSCALVDQCTPELLIELAHDSLGEVMYQQERPFLRDQRVFSKKLTLTNKKKVQRLKRIMLALPDETVWKEWFKQSGLAQSRQFTSAEALRATRQLLLAMARSNVQNQDIPPFVLPSGLGLESEF